MTLAVLLKGLMKLKNNILTVEVREVRKPPPSCRSAQDGVDLKELLQIACDKGLRHFGNNLGVINYVL